MADKARLLAALEEGRRRTWELIDGLPADLLTKAQCGFLSPPSWDLGHIANFEELWLVQNIQHVAELHPGYNDTYNAFEHPRSERPTLELLDRAGLEAYMAEVRQRVADVLTAIELDADPLTRDGFVHTMIALHEAQHQETLLQSLVMCGQYEPVQQRSLPEPRGVTPDWVTIPAGTHDIGTTHGPGSYDNEAPPQQVELPAFQMMSHPVTNGDMLRFIEAGGYDEPAHWSGRGWQWKSENAVTAPLYWQHDETWQRRNLTGTAPVAAVADEILCHVSFFEAEAYASWSGARLPTEAEWEATARRGGRQPWGDESADVARANIDHLGLGPSHIGSYPTGASSDGVEHLIGDVWEWTSSGFEAYPGFAAFPYDEYSKVFFGGDYKVLRGGAWSARAGCSRASFRNWDHPYRRQIMSGLRLARDVPS